MYGLCFLVIVDFLLYDFMVDCQKAETAYGKEVGEESSQEYHFARSDVFGFVIEYCNVYFRPLV